jgi:ABC-2 type transport system ATP-binding protein
MNSPLQIEAVDLHKTYIVTEKSPGIRGAIGGLLAPKRKTLHAVAGVSIAIGRGETVAYLGPNGAGKSTTIKMLSGILEPTSGSIRVCGLDPTRQRQQVAARIGVVFGQRSQLIWDLRLGESFELLRRIYGVPQDEFRRTLGWMDDVLQTGPLLDKPVRTLSLGQRMRGELAASLVHSPEVLFLDEPTIGLDLEAKHSVRQFIRSINASRGTTILLTTHDLDDVESLCRRLIVINHGRVVEDGPLDELIRRIARWRVLVVDCEHPSAPPDIEGATLVKAEGSKLTYKFERDAVSPPKLIARVSERVAIRDLTIEEPDIEDVLRDVYKESAMQQSKNV